MDKRLWKDLFRKAWPRDASTWKRAFIGLVVGSICVVLLAWQLDWDKVFATLIKVDLLLFGGAVLFTLLSDVVRAYRWKMIIDPVKRVSTLHLFRISMIGLMFNFILPIKAGDLIKTYLLSRQEKMHPASALSTVTVMRVYDLFCLMLIFGLGLPALSTFPWWLRKMAIIMVAVVVIGVVALYIIHLRPKLLGSALSLSARFLPEGWVGRLKDWSDQFSQATVSLGNPMLVLRTLLAGLLSWALLIISYYLALRSLAVDVPYLASFLLLAAIAFGFALPSLPGVAGPYQVAVVLFLALFGVKQEVALAVSFVTLLSDMIPLVSLGLFFIGTSTGDNDPEEMEPTEEGDGGGEEKANEELNASPNQPPTSALAVACARYSRKSAAPRAQA